MSNNDKDRQWHYRDVLLGYCFVVFGVISGLNTQTTFLNFGWLGWGGASFYYFVSDISLNNISFWYYFAGIIFLVIHAVFMGFFLYSYMHEKINISTRKRSILEMFYLSWIGGFSVIAVHIPRVILTYLAGINPEYNLEKEFLEKTHHISMQDWKLGLYPITQNVYDLANYGVVVIISYFAILFFFYFIRHRIHTKNSSIDA